MSICIIDMCLPLSCYSILFYYMMTIPTNSQISSFVFKANLGLHANSKFVLFSSNFASANHILQEITNTSNIGGIFISNEVNELNDKLIQKTN